MSSVWPAKISGTALLGAWWALALVASLPLAHPMAPLFALVLFGIWVGYPVLLIHFTSRSRAGHTTRVLSLVAFGFALASAVQDRYQWLKALGMVSYLGLVVVGAGALVRAESGFRPYKAMDGFVLGVALLFFPFYGAYFVHERFRKAARWATAV